MNNPNVGGPQGLPPLHTCIKPEQVTKLMHFPLDMRNKYHQGVTKLWETIHSRDKDSPEYQGAYKKLVEVSLQIKQTIKKSNETQPAAAQAAGFAQPNGGRPTSSGQQSPQDARKPSQQNQPGGPAQSQVPFSPQVIRKVQEFKVIPPPHVRSQGQEASKRFVDGTRQTYAQQLQKYEQANIRLQELENRKTQQANSLSPQEVDSINEQFSRIHRGRETLKKSLSDMHEQQKQLQQARIQAGNSGKAEVVDPSRDTKAQAFKQEPSQTMGALQTNLQHQTTQEHQGQPHTVSSALDAARNQPKIGGPHNAISPPDHGQLTHPPMNQPLNSHAQPMHGLNQTAYQPSTNVKTESQSTDAQNSSPHNAPAQSSNPTEPVPLSHQAAMQQARSYSYGPSQQHSTPQSATHGHPNLQTQHYNHQREPQPNSHSKMPIPSTLNVSHPQPVSMGQSRPTLTNGPLGVGATNQPAIQKHPGYVLEGDGERVLSKKKLNDLVRQVTGGSGGEGEEGEQLNAEVEETLLEVADDFIDQVTIAACKLAKIRGSNALDIRDIQLILERNYNIRIPGYASDELRTVKKIQPTQGWTQKLSAVQAAKVTGGKPDM